MTDTLSKLDSLKYDLLAKSLPFVGTRGDTRGPICVVGEAPGEEENRVCLPFVGASGKELDRMLADAGFAKTDLWFLNPFMTRPPDNKLDRLEEYGIPRQTYLDAFFEVLRDTCPPFIAACGATALGILCPFASSKKTGTGEIGKWRGSILRSPLLDWEHVLVPVTHPAAILREWSERVVAVLCLTKLFEEWDYWRSHDHKFQPLPERQLLTSPTAGDCIDYLRQCLVLWKQGKLSHVSNDIEMVRGQWPDMIAIAQSPSLSMSFQLYSYDQEASVKIWRLLDAVLQKIPTIGQNWINFDIPWLEHIGLSPSVDISDDTMVRAHVLYPELERSLHFLGLQYTRQPYWKDDGRKWTPKDGIVAKMKYNALDAAATYEVWQRQQEELDAEPNLKRFYYEYELPLAQAFHRISKRGIAVDAKALGELRQLIQTELTGTCSRIEQIIGRSVVPSNKGNGSTKRTKKAGEQSGPAPVNLGSPKQLLALFKDLRLKVPSFKGKESTGEEQINEMFAKTGHPVLKELLRIRELNKVLSTYVDVKLDRGTLYSQYLVTGTVTGRRSSRANYLGFGTNGQNLPKHSDLGKAVRKCLVARPGKIFVACDQVQAEDWIVQGIIVDNGGSRRDLDELIHNVDRHSRTAAFILGKPIDQCGKDTPARFVGKKVRHAGNYDMEEFRFSQVMAQEGFEFPVNVCAHLLNKFHEANPDIRGVFHEYVKRQLNTTRQLTTPLGRRRQFFSLRDFSDNKKIFKEGYAQIPQSTVGDNTGLAVLYLEKHHPGHVVQDGHDAIVLEVDDTPESIHRATEWLRDAFDREIKFPNGLTLKIPIEYEVGYNFKEMKKVDDAILLLEKTKAEVRIGVLLDSLRQKGRTNGMLAMAGNTNA